MGVLHKTPHQKPARIADGDTRTTMMNSDTHDDRVETRDYSLPTLSPWKESGSSRNTQGGSNKGFDSTRLQQLTMAREMDEQQTHQRRSTLWNLAPEETLQRSMSLDSGSASSIHPPSPISTLRLDSLRRLKYGETNKNTIVPNGSGDNDTAPSAEHRDGGASSTNRSFDRDDSNENNDMDQSWEVLVTDESTASKHDGNFLEGAHRRTLKGLAQLAQRHGPVNESSSPWNHDNSSLSLLNQGISGGKSSSLRQQTPQPASPPANDATDAGFLFQLGHLMNVQETDVAKVVQSSTSTTSSLSSHLSTEQQQKGNKKQSTILVGCIFIWITVVFIYKKDNITLEQTKRRVDWLFSVDSALWKLKAMIADLQDQGTGTPWRSAIPTHNLGTGTCSFMYTDATQDFDMTECVVVDSLYQSGSCLDVCPHATDTSGFGNGSLLLNKGNQNTGTGIVESVGHAVLCGFYTDMMPHQSILLNNFCCVRTTSSAATPALQILGLDIAFVSKRVPLRPPPKEIRHDDEDLDGFLQVPLVDLVGDFLRERKRRNHQRQR